MVARLDRSDAWFGAIIDVVEHIAYVTYQGEVAQHDRWVEAKLVGQGGGRWLHGDDDGLRIIPCAAGDR